MNEPRMMQKGIQRLDSRPILERSPRWVRVKFNGEIIADSKRVLLLRESGGRLYYFFPEDDVMVRFLQPGAKGEQGRQYFDLRVGSRSENSAAWTYPEPDVDLAEIKEHYTFRWHKMDHWYEEEEEVFVHPRDPYHRVDMVQSSREVQVAIDGVTIAESSSPVLLFETGLPARYYLSQDDIRMEFLESTKTVTSCPYKGDASYWSVKVNGNTYTDLVWGYMEPLPEAYKINKLLCFYNEKVDITVDGVLQQRPVTPWSD